MVADGERAKKEIADHGSVRRYYDEVYHPRARGEAGTSFHLRRLAARLEPWAGKRLLDVACGTGAWLRAAAAMGANPAGIDISQVALEACRQALPQADLCCAAAECLPFADQQFDFVSCLGALEHFLDPQAALREMIRTAKPDARFLLLVPNSGFLTLRLGLYSGTEQTGVHEEIRSLPGWQELFASVGLNVVDRWKDLHVLSPGWIFRGPWHRRALRAAQALALPLWPLCWQYQVYHLCVLRR